MLRRSLLLVPLAAPALALAQSAEGNWTPLFNGRDLSNFRPLGDANWRVEDGAVVADRGNGFLVTERRFADFQARIEVWLEPRTNSGVFIRMSDPATITAANSYEINLWDDRPEPRFGTGAIVNIAPVDPMPRAGNRWNDLEITARGDALSVVLNGQRTVDNARDGRFREGPFALQHGPGVNNDDRGVVRFRRVDVRAL